MGSKSRTKGRAAEQAVVQEVKAAGLQAVRTWSCTQNFDPAVRACDIRIESLPHQCKIQARAFKWAYDNLQYVSGLIFRRDRDEWIVCIRLTWYLQLLRGFFKRDAATGDTQ